MQIQHKKILIFHPSHSFCLLFHVSFQFLSVTNFVFVFFYYRAFFLLMNAYEQDMSFSLTYSVFLLTPKCKYILALQLFEKDPDKKKIKS